MTDKTKKIIAREGLVIISIILLMIVTGFMPNQIVLMNKNIQPKENEEVYEITTEGNIFGENVYVVLWNKKDNETKIKWDRYMVQADAEKDLAHLNIITRKQSLDRFKAKVFILIIFAYPLYLITRFIAWAVNTLRKK